MKMHLPKLESLPDIRKYLLIIETLEVDKLNNVLVNQTPLAEQHHTIVSLISIKSYYSEITDFLMRQQTENRVSEFEQTFVLEIENFLNFWQKIMNDFKKISGSEIEQLLEKNITLKNDLNELLEKNLGFRPPPNSLFLSLQAVRKIVMRLRMNQAIQYINFDYFKKHNIQLNENWIRDRKLIIIAKMERFERKLSETVNFLKEKLNGELLKLHAKRLAHFERLIMFQKKIRSEIQEEGAKEMTQLKKMRQVYFNRQAVMTMFHTNDLFLKDKKDGFKNTGKQIEFDNFNEDEGNQFKEKLAKSVKKEGKNEENKRTVSGNLRAWRGKAKRNVDIMTIKSVKF